MITFFQVQNEAGVISTVSGISFFESFEKLCGALTEPKERLPNGLETVADLLAFPMSRILQARAGAGGLALMTGNELDVGAVNENLMLGSLQGQDVAYVFQRQRRPSGGVVPVGVRLLLEPPASLGPQVFQVEKGAGVEKISFYILKRCFNLPFRFGASRPASNGPAFVVCDELCERGIEDWLSRLPAQDDGFLPIVQSRPRHAAKIMKGVLVAPDQGEEITLQGKVYVVPA